MYPSARSPHTTQRNAPLALRRVCRFNITCCCSEIAGSTNWCSGSGAMGCIAAALQLKAVERVASTTGATASDLQKGGNRISA